MKSVRGVVGVWAVVSAGLLVSCGGGDSPVSESYVGGGGDSPVSEFHTAREVTRAIEPSQIPCGWEYITVEEFTYEPDTFEDMPIEGVTDFQCYFWSVWAVTDAESFKRSKEMYCQSEEAADDLVDEYTLIVGKNFVAGGFQTFDDSYDGSYGVSRLTNFSENDGMPGTVTARDMANALGGKIVRGTSVSKQWC